MGVDKLKVSVLTTVVAILWNEPQGRARAPWRIVLPLLPVLVSGIVVVSLLSETLPIPALIFASQLTLAIAAFVAYAVSTRYLDRNRSVLGYGIRTDRRWWLDLSAGFGIGLIAVSIPSLIGIATGWYEISRVLAPGPMGVWIGLVVIALAYLCTGFWEELVFRGVFMVNAAEGLRGWFSKRNAIVVVLVLQAVVFGLVHVDQWTVQAPHPAFVITWIFGGLVYGLLYLLSDDLALPIGVHAAINTAEAGLFSGTAPADGGIPVIVLIEPVSTSTLAGHGGVLMLSRTLVAAVVGVLWLQYTRNGYLDLWTHPAFFASESTSQKP